MNKLMCRFVTTTRKKNKMPILAFTRDTVDDSFILFQLYDSQVDKLIRSNVIVRVTKIALRFPRVTLLRVLLEISDIPSQ